MPRIHSRRSGTGRTASICRRIAEKRAGLPNGCNKRERLSASGQVDAAFKVFQGREYVVEGGGLREIHVPHRLVITPQCRQTRCRRDETKGPRLRKVVAGPRTAKELSLPRYNPVPEVMLVDRPPYGRMPGQRRRVRVVAGEPVGRRFLGRPVIL